jgi:hypothetical protein
LKTPKQIAKHQTRFRRVFAKNASSYRLSLDCLTKEVHPCKGPPDTSQSRLSPMALHQAGGVGNAPVVICFRGDFGSEVNTVMDAQSHN